MLVSIPLLACSSGEPALVSAPHALPEAALLACDGLGCRRLSTTGSIRGAALFEGRAAWVDEGGLKIEGLGRLDRSAEALGGVGDLDGDGHPDLVTLRLDAVDVRLGGEKRETVFDGFVDSVEAILDADGDGADEIYTSGEDGCRRVDLDGAERIDCLYAGVGLDDGSVQVRSGSEGCLVQRLDHDAEVVWERYGGCSLELGDANGDGEAELVSGSDARVLGLRLEDGAEIWSLARRTDLWFTPDPVVRDVDGDRVDELVLGFPDEACVLVLEALELERTWRPGLPGLPSARNHLVWQGEPVWQEYPSGAHLPDGLVPEAAVSRLLGDVDGDGQPELGWYDSESQPRVRFSGGGEVALEGWFEPVVGDLDGDGLAEVALRHDANTVFLRGPGLDEMLISVDATGCLASGDLDGDGAEELLLGDHEGARLVSASSPEDPLAEFEGSCEAALLEDLDGDGSLDLLVAESYGALRLHRGLSAEPQLLWEPSDPVTGLQLMGDLDGDGRDEVGVHMSDWVVSTRLLDGASLEVLELGLGSRRARPAGDLDGDGRDELLVAQVPTGEYPWGEGAWLSLDGEEPWTPVEGSRAGEQIW